MSQSRLLLRHAIVLPIVLLIGSAALPARVDQAPDAAAIDGHYRIQYVDATLGTVTGRAVVRARSGSPTAQAHLVTIELRDPRTGILHVLNGNARIDGKQLVADVTGASAGAARPADATAEPASKIDLPGPVQLRIQSGGRSTHAQVVAPGALTIRLDLGAPALAGRWEQAAARNGQAGYRAGSPLAPGLVGGSETWTRDDTVAIGVLVLDDGGAFKTLPLYHGERFHLAVVFDAPPVMDTVWVDLQWTAASGASSSRIQVRKHEGRKDMFVSEPLTVPSSAPTQLRAATEGQAAEIAVVPARPIVQVRQPGPRSADSSLLTMNAQDPFSVEVRVPRAQATEDSILVSFTTTQSGYSDGLRLSRAGSRGAFELYTHKSTGTLAQGTEGEGGPPRTFLIPRPLVELYREYDLEPIEPIDGEILVVSWGGSDARVIVFKSWVDEEVAEIRERLNAWRDLLSQTFTDPDTSVEERKDSDLRLALVRNADAVAAFDARPVTESMTRREASFNSRFDEFNRLTLLQLYDRLMIEDLSGWRPLGPSERHFAIHDVRFFSVDEKDRFDEAMTFGDARWATRKEAGFLEAFMGFYQVFTGLTLAGQTQILGEALLHWYDGQTAVIDSMGRPVTREGIVQAAIEMGTGVTGLAGGTLLGISRLKAGGKISHMAGDVLGVVPRDPAPVLRTQRAIWAEIAAARGTRARMAAAGVSGPVQMTSAVAAAMVAAKATAPPPLPRPTDPPGPPLSVPALPEAGVTTKPRILRPGDADYPQAQDIVRPGEQLRQPIPDGARDAVTKPLPEAPGPSGQPRPIPKDSPWHPDAPPTIETSRARVPERGKAKFDRIMDVVERIAAADSRFKGVDRYAVAESSRIFLEGDLSAESIAAMTLNSWGPRGARVTPAHLSRATNMLFDDATKAVEAGWRQQGLTPKDIDIYDPAPRSSVDPPPSTPPPPAPRKDPTTTIMSPPRPPARPTPPASPAPASPGRFMQDGRALPERPVDGPFAPNRPLWGNRMLEAGEEGQRRVRELLERHGYEVVQNEIYAETVNQYAQDMLAGRFDWGRVPQADSITLVPIRAGRIIEHGHHRMIAALIVHEMTGRPLYTYGNDLTGANPVIPTAVYAPIVEGGKTKLKGVQPIVWNAEPNPYFPSKEPAVAVRPGRKAEPGFGRSVEDEILASIRAASVDFDPPTAGRNTAPRPPTTPAPRSPEAAVVPKSDAEALGDIIAGLRDEAFELRRQVPDLEARGQVLLAQQAKDVAQQLEAQVRSLSDGRPVPRPVGRPTYTAPPGTGFQDYVTWPGTAADRRSAYVSFRSGAGGRIEITDVQRYGQPPGSAGALVAAALREAGQTRPAVLRMSHIVHQRTLDEIAAGTPLENTVLGTTLRNAIADLDGLPVAGSWRTGLEAGKRFLEVRVVYRPPPARRMSR